jgi:hypothetical protein
MCEMSCVGTWYVLKRESWVSEEGFYRRWGLVRYAFIISLKGEIAEAEDVGNYGQERIMVTPHSKSTSSVDSFCWTTPPRAQRWRKRLLQPLLWTVYHFSSLLRCHSWIIISFAVLSACLPTNQFGLRLWRSSTRFNDSGIEHAAAHFEGFYSPPSLAWPVARAPCLVTFADFSSLIHSLL